MRKLILTLTLVLLISGCTGMPDIFGDIFGTQKTKVKELPPDVIVVQNINILPKPPISAGDQFSVSFEVANQEEEREVKYVAYDLLDSGLCNWNSRSRNSEEHEFTEGGNYFFPKQVEFVEWTFDTPSSSEIAYLSTKCPIRFKVNYSFEAISEIEVDVISEQKYNELQQSGGFKTFTPTLTLGRGPIKIYIDFGASLPIKTNTTLPVYVTVEDKGTGIYPIIPAQTLIIKVPDDFESPEYDVERFSCNKIDKFYVCNNTKDIYMIKRKSPTFRLSFITPQPEDVQIEKIYNIGAFLNYSYDVTEEVEVEVKPIS